MKAVLAGLDMKALGRWATGGRVPIKGSTASTQSPLCSCPTPGILHLSRWCLFMVTYLQLCFCPCQLSSHVAAWKDSKGASLLHFKCHRITRQCDAPLACTALLYCLISWLYSCFILSLRSLRYPWIPDVENLMRNLSMARELASENLPTWQVISLACHLFLQNPSSVFSSVNGSLGLLPEPHNYRQLLPQIHHMLFSWHFSIYQSPSLCLCYILCLLHFCLYSNHLTCRSSTSCCTKLLLNYLFFTK